MHNELDANLTALEATVEGVIAKLRNLQRERNMLLTQRAYLLAPLKNLVLPLMPFGQWDLVKEQHRPAVKQALIAIARAEGKSTFGNDWQDALSPTSKESI